MNDRTDSRSGSPPSPEAFDEVSRGVIDLFQQDDVSTDDRSVRYLMRGHLRWHLRKRGFHAAAGSVEVLQQSKDCDLVVDGRIGIKIVTNLHAGSKEWLHRILRNLFQEYDYLFIYGHQIPREHTDLWHQISRSIERYETGRDRIAIHGTFDTSRRRVTPDQTVVSADVVRKALLYGVFAVLLIGSSYYLDAAAGTNRMGNAFLAAVLALNCIAIVFCIYLFRYL